MFGNWENCKCKVCESDSQRQIDNEEMVSFYICPVCGRYEIKSKDASYDDLKNEFDLNKLSPYLAYNGFRHDGIDRQYYSNRDREWCNEFEVVARKQKCPVAVPMLAILQSEYRKSSGRSGGTILSARMWRSLNNHGR